jgi:hypothetical protein
MSGSGAGHVRQPSLKPSLGTGYVQSLGLNMGKAERPDIFGLGAGHVRESLLKPGSG